MEKTKYPGVWRLPKGAGFFVRTSGIDPKTGRLRPIKRKMPRATLKEAIQEVVRLRDVARSGGSVREPRKPTLTAFARSWIGEHFRRKKSDLTKARYVEALELHILPELGDHFIDRISRDDLEAWLSEPRVYGDREEGGDSKPYSAHTVNGWWRILKMIVQAAARKHALPDPTGGLKPLELPQREHENSLTPEELRSFLQSTRKIAPQWYTFVVLGFTLGMRPGELRPLRWDNDVDLETGTITVRQSQRRKYLGPTKTKRVREIALPPALVGLLKEHREAMRGSAGFGQLAFANTGAKPLQAFVRALAIKPKKLRQLRWDVEIDLSQAFVRVDDEERPLSADAIALLEKHRKASAGSAGAGELLFPSDVGGFISPSALDKPFRRIAAEAKISKPVTPKAMRRTAQDLSRLAGVNDLVTRAVSGHSDVGMQELYSTIRHEEVRRGLTAVTALAGLASPATNGVDG
jgi:integrase